MRKYFTDYTEFGEQELKNAGLDTSQIEDARDAGYATNHLHWPRVRGGHWDTLSVATLHHPSDGFLLDNGYIKVNHRDFKNMIESEMRNA